MKLFSKRKDKISHNEVNLVNANAKSKKSLVKGFNNPLFLMKIGIVVFSIVLVSIVGVQVSGITRKNADGTFNNSVDSSSNTTVWVVSSSENQGEVSSEAESVSSYEVVDVDSSENVDCSEDKIVATSEDKVVSYFKTDGTNSYKASSEDSSKIELVTSYEVESGVSSKVESVVESEPETSSASSLEIIYNPLAFLSNPYYIYSPISYEQAYGVYSSIETLSDIMHLIYKHSISGNNQFTFNMFAGYRHYYLIIEDFDEGTISLIFSNGVTGEKIVHDTKPLPEGYNYADVYGVFLSYSNPKSLLDQEKVDEILADGHVANFLGEIDTLGGNLLSDDGDIIAFTFYMPSINKYIRIDENYSDGRMYYKYMDLDDKCSPLVFFPYDGWVPLSPEADKMNYDIFKWGIIDFD